MNVLFVEESLDPSLGGIERVTYCLSILRKGVLVVILFIIKMIILKSKSNIS